MSKTVTGAQYGEASREDHRASGYRLPDHFYKAPEVDSEGFPVAAVPTNEDGSSIASETEPEVSNKAVLPKRAERKPVAKKAARKKK